MGTLWLKYLFIQCKKGLTYSVKNAAIKDPMIPPIARKTYEKLFKSEEPYFGYRRAYETINASMITSLKAILME